MDSLVNMEEVRLTVARTARVFCIGPPAASATKVLYALHGYGQLPQFFLRKFEPLAEAGWTVVAPEGLHRFYTEGTSGRVGASWMTREDRAQDIADYLASLAQVQEQFPAPAGARSVLLGFSQGVATAARWAAAGGGPFERLILWAGVFPPDVDLGPDAAALHPLPIDCVLGDADPFFGEGLLDETDARFREAGLTVRTTRFSGGHAICPTTLVRLLGGV